VSNPQYLCCSNATVWIVGHRDTALASNDTNPIENIEQEAKKAKGKRSRRVLPLH